MRNANHYLRLFIAILGTTMLLSCEDDRDYTFVTPIDKVALGKELFFDKNLSNPGGQSCATCHNPQTGFSDLNHNIVSEGALDGLFGNRNAPNVAYTMFAPTLHYDAVDGTYIGGFFLDGRVNTLEEQAKKPFMNPLEMNLISVEMLVTKLRQAPYYALYQKVYGNSENVQTIFDNIADAIATFEKSKEVNPFSSKYDYYLKDQATLTQQELRGLQLFNTADKGNCAACHISDPDEDSGKVLFTDFTYDNIGVPKNPNNPFYTIPASNNPLGANAVDYGLGAIVNDASHNGKFKVPSLRNVAISAPYFHNGFYNTLEEVVHFYNRRDVETFPTAEIPETVNHDELGNLGLTLQEEKDIVAFMKTLTDGYK
ncbi:c-type cytochrome [Flavobacterium sufflavum]|uniref:C-type cytochrome n=1 Tax=Flavobacterium sufflavum TaxID=1921138 RepID=A0A3S2V3N0_9FLAO|nr:cytochrome c peroxidase [Flavobacterium sufflavum]RVT75402.1 c-type cytochrome [Flavobacterium sufflavum]